MVVVESAATCVVVRLGMIDGIGDSVKRCGPLVAVARGWIMKEAEVRQ
jgi:hypothetical protein